MKLRKIPSAGPSITDAEIKLVTEAVKIGWYEKRGMHIDQFVKEFSKYTGIKYCLPTSNCTSAIHLALLVLGIGPGDEVIVPDITWVASVAPIHYVGATPLFADVEEDSWCLSPDSFEKLITSKTKAVIVVDLFGNMPNMNRILKIAKRNKLYVIEDAAEAMGAEYKQTFPDGKSKWKKAGTFGDVSTFSFNATKIMMSGQGGMFATDNKKLFEKAQRLIHHGLIPYSKKTFWSVEIGYNYQWTNIQAALALAQLRRINELVDKKKSAFQWYKKRLGNIEGIQLNAEPKDSKSTFWIVNAILGKKYKIRKERIMEEFKKFGIDTRPFFYPVSSQPAYSQYSRKKNYRKQNPVSYTKSSNIISLPSSHNLTESDVNYVCSTFLKILNKHKNK